MATSAALCTIPLPATTAATTAAVTAAAAVMVAAAAAATAAAATAATNEGPWYVLATPAIWALIGTRLSHANTRDSRRRLASPLALSFPELHHSKIDIDTEQPQHYIPP